MKNTLFIFLALFGLTTQADVITEFYLGQTIKTGDLIVGGTPAEIIPGTNLITFVSASDANAATGSITPNYPTGIQSGDVLIVAWQSSSQDVGTMDTNYWIPLIQGNGGGTSSRLGVWYMVYTGLDPSRTITNSGLSTITVSMTAWRGCNTNNPINAVSASVNGGTDTSIEHLGVTATYHGTLLLINSSGDDNTRSDLATFTVGSTTTATAGAPDGSVSIFYKAVAPGATGDHTVTQSGADAWSSVQLVLESQEEEEP